MQQPSEKYGCVYIPKEMLDGNPSCQNVKIGWKLSTATKVFNWKWILNLSPLFRSIWQWHANRLSTARKRKWKKK